jgi:thioredoxin 1
MEHLTEETFKEKILDYTIVNEENKNDIQYKNELPTILTFSAPGWCVPCQTLHPVLEEISKEYKNKVNVYEVDVDQEPMLSMAFGIRSVPTIIFIPMNEQPQMATGFLPKDTIKQTIKDLLKVD